MKQAHIIGCLVLHLALTASASAQEATEPPTYRPLIDRALSESRASHWQEARALFRRAFEIYPNARALRGLGMTSFELRDYVESVRSLRAALAHPVQPLTEVQHTQVEGLLAQALLFVGSYTLVAPENVVVTIDDRPLSLEPDGTVLLGLGAHRARARAEDGRTVESAFDVLGGDTGPLPIDFNALTPVVPEAPPVETHEEPVLIVTTPDAPTSAGSDVGPLVLLVSGGALAVAGGVCLGLGVADADAVSAAARGTEWSDVGAVYDRAPVLQGVGAAALGVGVVMAGIGGVLLATSSSDPVQVQVHADGLSLRGVW
jgi:hypothetical protein